ncbi:hypothetical protein Tco_0843153 [Tanacetum coccineum]|uniref:Uncharacterized protein n=1 Tax=Tanacetum coccineum TaxID=301880 RepID=A0ABQ5B189_9ASTR
MADIPKSFPLVHKNRLLDLFNQEVGEDVARVREYIGVACGLKIAIRRREEYIGELKALGSYEGVVKTVRFMEGMQQDDMERYDRSLFLMKEVEVKACEKSRFILKLSDKAKASIRIQRGAEVQCCAFKLVITQRMAALPRCDELRRASCSPEWKDMFILYCRRAIAEDIRLAREINGMCDGLTAVIKERELFIGELDTLEDRFMPEKMCKFSKETQAKDTNKLMKLQILGREFEIRAREINCFIEKLKGTMDY